MYGVLVYIHIFTRLKSIDKEIKFMEFDCFFFHYQAAWVLCRCGRSRILPNSNSMNSIRFACRFAG